MTRLALSFQSVRLIISQSLKWYTLSDLNGRPIGYKPIALTTELRVHDDQRFLYRAFNGINRTSYIGLASWNRTNNPKLRRLVLYPVELWREDLSVFPECQIGIEIGDATLLLKTALTIIGNVR